ncbi:MAG: transcriptional regulator [Armatimonadetes bacterium]|nr:transcriptional regulator [Armatimonadota bacterium]
MSAANVGVRLREGRLRCGFSVGAAAEIARVSTSTIKRWEAGKGVPRMDGLRAYAGSLSLTADDLDASDIGTSAQRLLRAKRRRSHTTLETLSALSGLSISSLHRFETGARALDGNTARHLGRVYGCADGEIEVLAGSGPPIRGDVVSHFLTPGLFPHASLYVKLDRLVRQSELATPEDVLDVIHGLIIMGDHAGMLESWQLLQPKLVGERLTSAQKTMVQLTLALAMATARNDLRPARRLLQDLHRLHDIPTTPALSHMSRLAAMDKNFVAAKHWNTKLADAAEQSGDRGQAFISKLNGTVLHFELDKSCRHIDAIETLQDECEGPLQQYTLLVAKLSILVQLKESTATRSTLCQCHAFESQYGFGSPLASRIERRLDATGQWLG